MAGTIRTCAKFKYSSSDFLWRIFNCLGTPYKTSSPGCDQTHLLTSGSESVDGSGFTQVLVVTTTVGVVHGVHADTGDLGESLSLSLKLVEEHTSLHDGLFVTASTGDDANGGSAGSRDGLSGS